MLLPASHIFAIENDDNFVHLGRRDKRPLEEVKSTLHPTPRTVEVTHAQTQRRRKVDVQPTRPNPTPNRIAVLETPISWPSFIVLTATGEMPSTPAPTALSKLFDSLLKVGLNFAKIFDFDKGEKCSAKHHN